jgi:copper chaperone CopZ
VAIETLSAVDSVQTDMDDHTVTVAFDDDQLAIDAVVQALNKAGYSVPEYDKN